MKLTAKPFISGVVAAPLMTVGDQGTGTGWEIRHAEPV